jgi:hypothetical protein
LEVAMTRMAIKEYVDALRGRYLRGSKKEKGQVLNEFVGVVGCHRKSAVRLLGRRRSSAVRESGAAPGNTKAKWWIS